MIRAKLLLNLLVKNNSNFFTGVPDSVLKEFSLLLTDKKNLRHIIASNEGSAVSLGIGNYLSTKKIPCIYFQNSGLPNALNPLFSIAHKKVYSIPLILIIGWRGSPKIKDEPQHNIMGQVTERILKLLNIKYTTLRNESDLKNFEKQIKQANKKKSIVACLIEQGTFEKNKILKKKKDTYNLNKEFFLDSLLRSIKNNTRIISSTGYTSRELMYLRKKNELKKGKDFYMVGGMGHTASVALGYSLSSKKETICLDGDGSFLMHLGSIKTAGNFSDKNFKYILLNNNCHDSVGGQTTYADNINYKNFSKSIGFNNFHSIYNKKNIRIKIQKFLNTKSRGFLEVKIANNKIKKLPRPKNLLGIKDYFIK